MPSYIPGSPSHWTGDMTETITVYKKQASRDNYGKASISGTATTYSARVQADVSRTRDSEGVEVVEGGYAYVLNDANIEVGDRLVLPGGNEPVILSVDKITYMANNAAAVHHTKIRFGRS